MSDTKNMSPSCLPRLISYLFVCLLGNQASALASDTRPPTYTIAVCDDENEWPPYSYYQRVGDTKTAVVTGFAVAVLDDIFKRRGVAYTIDLIPWARCLAVTILGKEYGMVLNMSHNTERAKSFLFSRPYYATTAYYYYSRQNHPAGLSIGGRADIRKYRVCGVQGYNYDGYGIPPGEVDQGAKNFEALINKVKLGRCAMFLEKDEIMMGYSTIGKHYLADPDLAKAPIPGMKPSLFYFAVSKRYPHAEQLRSLIDEELIQMESNGKLAALWKKTGTPARK